MHYYCQIKLSSSLQKKFTKLREAATGDWKGMPFHITLFDLEFKDETKLDTLMTIVCEFMEEPLELISLEVKVLGDFLVIVYDGKPLKLLYEKLLPYVREDLAPLLPLDKLKYHISICRISPGFNLDSVLELDQNFRKIEGITGKPIIELLEKEYVPPAWMKA